MDTLPPLSFTSCLALRDLAWTGWAREALSQGHEKAQERGWDRGAQWSLLSVLQWPLCRAGEGLLLGWEAHALLSPRGGGFGCPAQAA